MPSTGRPISVYFYSFVTFASITIVAIVATSVVAALVAPMFPWADLLFFGVAFLSTLVGAVAASRTFRQHTNFHQRNMEFLRERQELIDRFANDEEEAEEEAIDG